MGSCMVACVTRSWHKCILNIAASFYGAGIFLFQQPVSRLEMVRFDLVRLRKAGTGRRDSVPDGDAFIGGKL